MTEGVPKYFVIFNDREGNPATRNECHHFSQFFLKKGYQQTGQKDKKKLGCEKVLLVLSVVPAFFVCLQLRQGQHM